MVTMSKPNGDDIDIHSVPPPPSPFGCKDGDAELRFCKPLLAAPGGEDSDASTRSGPPSNFDSDADSECEREESDMRMDARRSLRDKSMEVEHWLNHKPGIPYYCHECRIAKA